jgi:hypothetical protein
VIKPDRPGPSVSDSPSAQNQQAPFELPFQLIFGMTEGSIPLYIELALFLPQTGDAFAI